MLKPFILGSAIAVLSTLSLSAIAADWRITGVSNRTRETVAIDMDSIDRSNGRFDVRFRYLIGKDLVQASVNCDSSLVTSEQGKPFVPDMTGATREMIKLACGNSQPSAVVTSAPSFYVSDEAIVSVRRISYTDFAKYRIPDDQIEQSLRAVCRIYMRGGGRTIDSLQASTMVGANAETKVVLADFYSSVNIVARSRVCPEYAD